ncbi:MAG: glutamine-hydrolyzing carbamoyl-phosphate synthase small subunit [Candidatus Omnitrophica bacterium]|nr:glutamine-hydrolyzing carbamoyl-phosphate synthase small subunit [Candidatus Omnitrophota bacterium]
MKAILMLEDGKSFLGETEGLKGERIGEVIMNTVVVGYQEMITDPANADKILVLTYPLIGNYGCSPKFNESDNIWLAGLVIKEKSRIFSNWQAKESFDDFVKRHNLLSLYAVDTRTLAVHLRQKGSMLGIISTNCFEAKELLAKIKDFSKNKPLGLLAKISTEKKKQLGLPGKKKIAILDLGITNSIIRQLESLGLSLTILPFNTTAEDILRIKPKGLIISGGPEEITELEKVAENIRPLIGKVPILGISSGNLVLAIVLGVKLNKLKTGHRGVNYPVQSPCSFKGEITVQNHAYVLDPGSLLKIKGLKITSYNLNDRTVEEIESRKLKILGVQYAPSSPGFNEVHNVFNRFMKMLGRN